jgi:hypothetical protein
VFSRGLALITVTGRRSGCRYTFPVDYRQDEDRVLINVGWPERKYWWRSCERAATWKCVSGAYDVLAMRQRGAMTAPA